jgi:hypothetical protein
MTALLDRVEEYPLNAMTRRDAAHLERGDALPGAEGDAPPLVGLFDRVKRLLRRQRRDR